MANDLIMYPEGTKDIDVLGYSPAQKAAERSYQESLSILEKVAAMQRGAGQIVEIQPYDVQVALQQFPEIFIDVTRAETEIGLPTAESLAASYPEFATGTMYEEYGTTAPAIAAAAAAEAEAQEVYRQATESIQGESYPPSDWGDMLAMVIVALIGFGGLTFLLGKR